MTKAIDILKRAARILQDPDFVRWTKEEMLVWLSEGQVAIARVPGAYTKFAILELKEGARQALPSDAWGLLTITHNVDEDGSPLKAVRLVTRSLLDCYEPNWHGAPERQIVENFVYDDRSPREFYVYPPNDGYGRLEISYMAIPKELTAETDETVLDETFDPALLSYVLYRAQSKDSDYAPGLTQATGYFQTYTQELSNAMVARGASTPNASLVPGAANANGGTE
ncbi:DUF6682 family protein [Paratractidigestivibacter sp.]|uniref:phage adaptor protein n=1 Tax=Paratractidigestivibacter sp. TaxID=2847316 RepID=UPI002AC974F6|nr:DUF6682 family protein [Paratractidigestivibacter sp.]